MKGIRHFIASGHLIAAALLTLAACGERRDPGILSRAEMVKVMQEIYIGEEKVNHLGLPRDSARQIAEIMKNKILENADLTDSVFRKSFDYYMEHPAQLELIYTALVDSLHLREQRTPFRPDLE